LSYIRKKNIIKKKTEFRSFRKSFFFLRPEDFPELKNDKTSEAMTKKTLPYT
jgi:hypothetical protein